jgi:hypothetical protein
MSYVLHLTLRKQGRPVGPDEALAWLAAHAPCTVNGLSADYRNEDTGTYFYFSYRAPDDRLHFRLNYLRPRTFALEAAHVLDQLGQAFELTVDDPQEGPAAGGLTERLLAGWGAANRDTYWALLARAGPERIYTVPTRTQELFWNWNYSRAGLAPFQAGSQAHLFLPPVRYIIHSGRAQSLCVWPNLVPAAFPAVDWFFILRDQLPGCAEQGAILVPGRDLFAASGAFVHDQGASEVVRYSALDYPAGQAPPAGLVAWACGWPTAEEELVRLEADRVFDEELVRELRPAPEP